MPVRTESLVGVHGRTGMGQSASGIAPENDKWNSVTIHAKLARTSREFREFACLIKSEAFANA